MFEEDRNERLNSSIAYEFRVTFYLENERSDDQTYHIARGLFLVYY